MRRIHGHPLINPIFSEEQVAQALSQVTLGAADSIGLEIILFQAFWNHLFCTPQVELNTALKKIQSEQCKLPCDIAAMANTVLETVFPKHVSAQCSIQRCLVSAGVPQKLHGTIHEATSDTMPVSVGLPMPVDPWESVILKLFSGAIVEHIVVVPNWCDPFSFVSLTGTTAIFLHDESACGQRDVCFVVHECTHIQHLKSVHQPWKLSLWDIEYPAIEAEYVWCKKNGLTSDWQYRYIAKSRESIFNKTNQPIRSADLQRALVYLTAAHEIQRKL